MQLRSPLSGDLEEAADDQFVGIEFNPSARTTIYTFRLASRQSLLLSVRLLDSFLPRFEALTSRAPQWPIAAFSLFPSTPTNTYGLYTSQGVVSFH